MASDARAQCGGGGPDETCLRFTTNIGITTFFFTREQFGKDIRQINEFSNCEGTLTKGSIRYYTNGTAPSSVVGTLYTLVKSPIGPPPPYYIELHGRDLIRGFKATAANGGGGVLSWECNMNQHPNDYYKK